jgi:predicted phage terminase large subunit-like protein
MATPEDTKRLIAAACRTDFVSFVQKCFHSLNPGAQFEMNWHILATAHQLEEVRHGNNTQLVVNAPPRSLKSLMTSVAFSAFILGHDPTKRIIGVSYAMDLATKLHNDFRTIVTARWYQDLFPEMRISRAKNSEIELVTTGGGSRFATSIDGTLTGRGGDVVVIDDPLAAADALSDAKRERVNEWFKNTLLSRRNDPRSSAIILVGQRLHADDLTGALLRNSDAWKVLSLAAIAEQEETIKIGPDEYHIRRAGDILHAERMPRSLLDQIRSLIGANAFAAQYQQAPVPPGGIMIKREWIRRYEYLPPYSSASRVIQSWDTASKAGSENDWSVCATLLLEDNKYYLVDVLRGRFDYPTLRTQAIEQARTRKPSTILIEDDAGVGTALVAELKNAGLSAVRVRPVQDKVTRMSIQSGKFESGRVVLPTRAPWLPEFEAELFTFPNGRHDDQIDSISQALAHEIPTYEWTAKHSENFGKLIEGLAMDRAWGIHMGRPW